MTEMLRELRAALSLAGISRREAAKALYLSYTALNRKLRGELPMAREEMDALRKLLEGRGPRK
ncbi:MAG TPA: hypothetical protein VLA21_11745 [Candidatus Limnocylindria bacterium]|nr:hypothetical protein [Candidatus Limnocylindria bacterium]